MLNLCWLQTNSLLWVIFNKGPQNNKLSELSSSTSCNTEDRYSSKTTKRKKTKKQVRFLPYKHGGSVVIFCKWILFPPCTLHLHHGYSHYTTMKFRGLPFALSWFHSISQEENQSCQCIFCTHWFSEANVTHSCLDCSQFSILILWS